MNRLIKTAVSGSLLLCASVAGAQAPKPRVMSNPAQKSCAWRVKGWIIAPGEMMGRVSPVLGMDVMPWMPGHFRR